jgi:hypothetical protein
MFFFLDFSLVSSLSFSPTIFPIAFKRYISSGEPFNQAHRDNLVKVPLMKIPLTTLCFVLLNTLSLSLFFFLFLFLLLLLFLVIYRSLFFLCSLTEY